MVMSVYPVPLSTSDLIDLKKVGKTNDDEYLGRTRLAVNEENVQIVPNDQRCIFSLCYKAFAGAYSSYLAKISRKRS